MRKKIKKISLFLLIISVMVLPAFNVSALTINSTYRDMAPSNSTSSNLLSLAQNYNSFLGSKFVIFSDSQYSYYIVWGNDIKLENNRLIGSKIEYLRYYRTSTNSDYLYVYGSDTSFSLTSSYHNTSNIDGYGFVSLNNLEREYYFYQKYNFMLLIAFSFVIAVTCLKRSNAV